jgi:Protein of unknown function (DUF2934)
MAREVASTRIPGTESQLPVPEPPVLKPAANPPTANPAAATAAASRENVLRPLFLVPHRLTPAERYRRICELAYRRAEQRGFAPGSEVEDWLEAEREVDAGRY